MNDEGPSSSALPPQRRVSHFTSGEDRIQEIQPPQRASSPAAEVIEGWKRKKIKRDIFNAKRADLLHDLLWTLDMLVYAELSTVYYMDCSFFRFLIRAVVHFVLLTPKPVVFPELPFDQPYIGGILGSNILCLIVHAFSRAPAAGEETGGYLHGGLAMDFIGQKGPSSKIQLLSLDLLILSLQFVQLAAHITRLRLTHVTATVPATAVAPASQPDSQDLDAEERGIRRSDEAHDIEMRVLNPSDTPDTAPRSSLDVSTGNVDTTSEPNPTLASTAPPTIDARAFDAFYTGQIVIADLNVVRTTTEQFWLYRTASPESLNTSRTMRANIVSQLLNQRFTAAAMRPAQQP